MSENLRTGLVLPLLSSASGLAFAAWLPLELTTRFIDAELGATGLLGPSLELPAQLAQIRASGLVRLVAIDQFTELYGGAISAVSVPVFGADGAMVLAIGAIGAVDRLDTTDEGRLVTELRLCAASLSKRLAG